MKIINLLISYAYVPEKDAIHINFKADSRLNIDS